LSRKDLEHVIEQVTPATLSLGKQGELRLAAPSEVLLVEGRGVEIRSNATLRWNPAGLSEPAALGLVSLCLEPAVERRSVADVLVFRVRLTQLEGPHAPLAEEINEALRDTNAELKWDFTAQLTRRLRIPAADCRDVDLTVSWGELRITTLALVFAVSVHVEKLPLPSSTGRSLAARWSQLAATVNPARLISGVRNASPRQFGIASTGLAACLGLVGALVGVRLGRKGLHA
jgi:hypothetical protein